MKAVFFALMGLMLASCDQPKAAVEKAATPEPARKPISDFATIVKIFPNQAGGVVVKLSNDDSVIYAPDQAVDIAIHWKVGDEVFEKAQEPKTVEKEGEDKFWNKGDGWWVDISEARRNQKIKD